MSSIHTQLGRVAHQLPSGGENRPGQLEMAEAVSVAIEHSSALLVEAGTGTGKSFAYLTPIVDADKRAVIATATIALQGQIVGNDVPLVASGLDVSVSSAVLKGRGNYLCLQRLVELDRSSHQEQLQLLSGTAPGPELKRVRAWADSTKTGDKEELDPSPPPEVWRAVSVGADECPGAARCPSGEECFSERARNIANSADIIVTNHHYYGLHLASGGALLPEHDVVVFDEAHHLPEVLGATCGTELSGNRLRSLGRKVRAVLTDEDLSLGLDRSAIDLDNLLRESVGTVVEFTTDLVSVLTNARDRSDRALNGLKKAKPSPGSDTAAKVERAQVGATSITLGIDQFIDANESDVVWVDGSQTSPVLRRTPIEVGDILDQQLWGNRAVILTSATLPDGLVPQLGLGPSTEILRVGSPFNFPELGLLYCPLHLPEPRDPNARQAVRDEMATLIQAAGGRTLGLFTSISAMQEAAEQLRDELDFPVLVQGEKPKPALIQSFKDDPCSVLLATMSFWQGVDLPGDTLTLVTIDRLPFPRPDEPVMQARRDRAGPAAFRTIDLPRAQTLLAQGAGRLVRRNDDRGVVAVLDTRFATKRAYRWDLINALPPLKRTKNQAEVVEFLQALDGSSGTNAKP